MTAYPGLLLLGAALCVGAASALPANGHAQTRSAAKQQEKAQNKKKSPGKDGEEKKPAEKWLPPPYEPQLLRLSELMGALDYLEGLCGGNGQNGWRLNMQKLMQAESQNPLQKERLAGAFNAGYRGYALNYRTCTDNARLVIRRYLIEGEKIASDVASRFGGG